MKKENYNLKMLNIVRDTIKDIDNDIIGFNRTKEVLRRQEEDLLKLLTEEELNDIESSGISVKNDGYPTNGELIDKLMYLESKHNRMWDKKEMFKEIFKREGKDSKTLKYFPQQLFKLVDDGDLVNMRYGTSYKFSFYCTNSGFISENEKGEKYVLPEHAPDPSLLKNIPAAHSEIKFDGLIKKEKK